MVVFTHTHAHLVAFWKWLRLLVPGVYREQGRPFCAPMLVSGGSIVSREGRFSARCWLRGAGCVERVAGGRAGDEPARSWWGRHWVFLEYS